MNSEYNVAMILTQRDPTERFYSMIRYAKKRNRIPQKESEIQNSVDKYYDHQKFCRDLAKKNKIPLLELDVTKNKNAGILIKNFLGLEQIDISFPHINKT